MKVIVQIPCYNESETLAVTLGDIPRRIDGVDCVEILVIDDGSSDRTVEVAKQRGADHIVRLTKNQGLATAFLTGLDACLKLGADVIVNTDADNQYCADDIPLLLKPILEKRADIVIGSRPIADIEHFSAVKKLLQYCGSWVVRKISRTNVTDAPSGFRAMSRSAAMRLNVFNRYTYTLETIIQAGQKGMAVECVPIRTNDCLRPSRLVKNMVSYVKKSIVTMVRIFVVYRPFLFFATIGVVLAIMGFILCVRYLALFFMGEGTGHVQSLILASVLLGMGFQTILVAFLADLLAVNRIILEDLQFKLKRLSYDDIKSVDSGVKNNG